VAILDNVTTSEEYTDATTLTEIPGAHGGFFQLNDAPAFVSFQYGAHGHAEWTPDIPCFPPGGTVDAKATGMRFKDYTPGNHSIVFAYLAAPASPFMAPILSAGGGQGGLVVTSAVDFPSSYPSMLTHDRHLMTAVADYEYAYAQLGRLIGRDGFDTANVQWRSIGAGGIALSTVRYLKGGQALRTTTGAGAGSQAAAHKQFPLAADQAFGFPFRLVTSVWFSPADANWRDVQVFLRVDDSVTRWEAAVRFHRRQAGVAQDNVQYLDSGGTFQTVQTYQLPDGGNVDSPWHFLMLAMDYHQLTPAAGGYFNYRLIKLDDVTWVPTVEPTSARAIASNGVRDTTVALTNMTDGIPVADCDWDEFFLSDLANVLHLTS